MLYPYKKLTTYISVNYVLIDFSKYGWLMTMYVICHLNEDWHFKHENRENL